VTLLAAASRRRGWRTPCLRTGCSRRCSRGRGPARATCAAGRRGRGSRGADLEGLAMSGMPTRRAGAYDMRSATSAQVSRPVRTNSSATTDSAVSRPSIPIDASHQSACLVSGACGAMIRTDDIDRAVDQRLADGLDIGDRAQGRVDLVHGVAGRRGRVVQHEVVRRRLGGDRVALRLRPAHDRHRRRRRDVAGVDAAAELGAHDRVHGRRSRSRPSSASR